MSFQLTGDQLKTGMRRLGDIQRQLGQAEYPHDPDKLLNSLQAVGEGKFEAVGGGGVLFPCQVHAADLLPQGYTVLEDVVPQEFQVADLDFIGFLEGKEGLVSGRVMRGRAVIKGAVFGLSDGKRMLAEQTHIPTAALRGKYIVLTGTLLRRADGGLYVACLDWDSDQWVLSFCYLDRGFHDFVRLPRRKETGKAT